MSTATPIYASSPNKRGLKSDVFLKASCQHGANKGGSIIKICGFSDQFFGLEISCTVRLKFNGMPEGVGEFII